MSEPHFVEKFVTDVLELMHETPGRAQTVEELSDGLAAKGWAIHRNLPARTILSHFTDTGFSVSMHPGTPTLPEHALVTI